MFDSHHAPPLPPEELAALVARYREPHRAYHTDAHITAVLRWFDAVADGGPGWVQPVDVYLAILFHDAVYDAKAHDNEARSAELVRARSARAAELVLLTAKHGSLADVPDPDAAHFLDADMSILGAAPEVFDAYDAAVRVEYAHVPEAMYRAGRGGFLRKVAALPRIFFSDFFHTRLDAPARTNLARAIARLEFDVDVR